MWSTLFWKHTSVFKSFLLTYYPYMEKAIQRENEDSIQQMAE